MSNIRCPAFKLCGVYDLTSKFGALPNRIYIQAIYIKEDKKEWMYNALCETSGEVEIFSEKFIKDNLSSKSKPVYRNRFVKDMYKAGYRFAGNYPDWIAKEKSEKIVIMDTIDFIQLHPALDALGNAMSKDYRGIWIKFKLEIYDNGWVRRSTPPEIINKPEQ